MQQSTGFSTMAPQIQNYIQMPATTIHSPQPGVYTTTPIQTETYTPQTQTYNYPQPINYTQQTYSSTPYNPHQSYQIYPNNFTPNYSQHFSQLTANHHPQNIPPMPSFVPTPFVYTKNPFNSNNDTAYAPKCDCQDCLEDPPVMAAGRPPKGFKCTHRGCGRVFSNLIALKTHIPMHKIQRYFVCEWRGCGDTFFKEQELQQHVNGHTLEERFTCLICEVKFRDGDELSKHSMVHAKKKVVAVIRGISEESDTLVIDTSRESSPDNSDGMSNYSSRSGTPTGLYFNYPMVSSTQGPSYQN